MSTTEFSPPPGALASSSSSSGQTLRVRICSRTDVGRERGHNEDNYLVADLGTKARIGEKSVQSIEVGERGLLLAVCDGMGGAAAGEVASQMAVDTLYEEMLRPENAPSREELARGLMRAVEEAGGKIFAEAAAKREMRGMGTTVTAAVFRDENVFFAQVGDSRAYLVRGGVVTQVTRDQSLVNKLIEAGQLTEEEAESYEHTNIILQALGTSDRVEVDLTHADLRQGDMLMLCSDGLSGMLKKDGLEAVLLSGTDPEVLCEKLIDGANAAGGSDNITVIVMVVEGAEDSKTAATEEPVRYKKFSLPPAASAGPVLSIAPAPTVITGESSGETLVITPTYSTPKVEEAVVLPKTEAPSMKPVVIGAAIVVLGLVGWLLSK